MNDTLILRPAAGEDDAERDRLVLAHPRGTFFHLAGWRRAVQRCFGHRPMDLLAFEQERMVGVLPLMACRGLKGGQSWISMPYAVYGGPLGARPEVEKALFAEAEQRALRARVGRLELRAREDLGLDLPRSELYATFIRELPEAPEEVLARMPKKARAEARKARDKHGLELSEGTGSCRTCCACSTKTSTAWAHRPFPKAGSEPSWPSSPGRSPSTWFAAGSVRWLR